MPLVPAQPSGPNVPPPDQGTGITYGMLKQKHPDYEGELWHKLDLLWKGGWQIKDRAKLFLPQLPDEPKKHYSWRLKVTSYVNYFSQLVGFLAGALFNETLLVGPEVKAEGEGNSLPDQTFYEAFAKDCDKQGTAFSQFIRSQGLVRALVFKRALVQVDLPKAQPLETGTLSEEDALGNRRAYLLPIDLGSLFNWSTDAFGAFRWCILHSIFRDDSSPFADRSVYQHQFKIWTIADGVAQYVVLRSKPVKKDDELRDEDEMQVVEPLTATSFRMIPIVTLDLPEALWVGNQAGPLCAEHFHGRSDLKGSIARNLTEIPYVKRGAEVPPVYGGISETQGDPNRGADPVGRARRDGWVAIGSEDELGFAGPSGVAHSIASQELKDLREEIFRSVNAMSLQLENSAAAVGRSGESKREDKSALETLLTFMGDQTREFAEDVMAVVSSARGEIVQWQATGLSTFDHEDRAELVDEAVLVEPLRIPSPTWARIYKTRIALATVPKASAEQKKDIEREIKNNLSDEEVLMDPFEKAERMTKAQNPPELAGGNDDDEEGSAPPAKTKAPPAKSKKPAKKAPAGKK